MFRIIALVTLAITHHTHLSYAAGPSMLELIPEKEDTGAVLVVYNVVEPKLQGRSWEDSFECEVSGGHLQMVGGEWERITKVGLSEIEESSFSGVYEFQTRVILRVVYEVEGNLTCRDVLGLNLTSNTLLLRFRMDQLALIRFTIRSPEKINDALDAFWTSSSHKMTARLTSVNKQGTTAVARVSYHDEFVDDDILIENISRITHRLSKEYDFQVEYVRSPRWCHREEGGGFVWPMTPVGGRTAPFEPCVDSRGTPAPTRSCKGDFFSGVYWSALPSRPEPCERAPEHYRLLRDAAKTASETGSLEELTEEMARGPLLTASEIPLISAALRDLSRRADMNSANLSMPNVSTVAKVVDSVLKSGKVAIQTSDAVFGSSDAILDSVDRLLRASASSPPSQATTGNFTAFAASAEAKVSGFALIPDKAGKDHIVPLYRNHSKEDVLSMSPKVAAILLESPADTGLTSTVMEEDALFQEHSSKRKVLGPVVGMTVIPMKGQDRTYKELLVTLLLLFSRDSDIKGERACHYWDRKDGRWSVEGCHVTNDTDMIGCQCGHLTHFAMLLTCISPSDSDKDRLHIITSVGCFASLVCLVAIFVIATISPQSRQGASRKVHLHVSASQALLMLSYLTISILGDGHEPQPALCVALGSLLHYFLLASFAWMLVAAALQTLRLTPKLAVDARRRAGTHLVLRASLLAWGLPALPPFLNFCIDAHAYKRRPGTALCYPEGDLFLATVLAPASFVILMNASIFIWIMRCLFCTASPSMRVHLPDPKKQLMRRCFAALFLFSLLGLSWLLGIAVELSAASESSSIVFAYLFCATSTLQGASMFVFFVWEKLLGVVFKVLLKLNGNASRSNSCDGRRYPRRQKRKETKSAESKGVRGKPYYLSKNNHSSPDEIRFKEQYQEVINELIRKIDNV